MPEPHPVAEHYNHGQLLEAICQGVEALGKSPETVTVDDLAAADEFHIGGRQASEEFIAQLDLMADMHVLDVGCGIGGTSRFVADRFGCRVSGVDLTPEFVETGRVLCDWVGLNERVDLQLGSALNSPFAAESFDAAFMLHVGMNIADKAMLCQEVYRVLKPGGVFGIYDVMRKSNEPLVFPVPWSTTPDTNWLATPDEYQEHLRAAGFEITATRDRHAFAIEFFENVRRCAEESGALPPLGVHIAMSGDAPIKIRNMLDNLKANRLAPVEVIARKG
jgi:SAM-dependent methyltransferase